MIVAFREQDLVSAPWLYLAFKNLKVRLALYLQDSTSPRSRRDSA